MIKRLDIFIDTDKLDQDIINIIKYEIGEVLVYNIDRPPVKDKEEVIDYVRSF